MFLAGELWHSLPGLWCGLPQTGWSNGGEALLPVRNAQKHSWARRTIHWLSPPGERAGSTQSSALLNTRLLLNWCFQEKANRWIDGGKLNLRMNNDPRYLERGATKNEGLNTLEQNGRALKATFLFTWLQTRWGRAHARINIVWMTPQMLIAVLGLSSAFAYSLYVNGAPRSPFYLELKHKHTCVHNGAHFTVSLWCTFTGHCLSFERNILFASTRVKS